MRPAIFSVVVTYNPDPEKLVKLVDEIKTQTLEVVIVDNASRAVPPLEGVTLLSNRDNEGLAFALNRGIQYGLDAGYSHVVLFDQDSAPEMGMVQKLYADLEALESSGAKVGAIGPKIVDARDGGVLPFVKFGFPLNQKLAPIDKPLSCDFLITSGVLIPVDVLKSVGLMREGLFIDNIDIEWCARAKGAGFQLFGSASAHMFHELGDSLLRLPFISAPLAVHSAPRLYYYMRNRVLLYRLRHVTRLWVAQDIIRIPMKILVFSLLVPGRLENLRYMIKGLIHGLRGAEGRL